MTDTSEVHSEEDIKSTETAYRNPCIVVLYESGKLTQQEVAQVFQVSQGLVSQIYVRYRQDGFAGLQGSSAPVASAKLTDTQQERFGTLLDQGATAHDRTRVARYGLQSAETDPKRPSPEGVRGDDMERDALARDKKTADVTTSMIGYADEAAFYLLPSVGVT